MNGIFFLIFAFFTVFLSIKLSCYADELSKRDSVNNAVVGGIVLAGVTALPEFVTCFSAITINNVSLAMGDVLGSTIFNFFMVGVFDIIFIKKMFFCKISSFHDFTLVLLMLNYIVIFLCCLFFKTFTLFLIGVPSLFIFISYIFYIVSISKKSDVVIVNDNRGLDETLVLKLVITAILLVLSSLLLTIVVNNLSFVYPFFSSGFLGAIFLGITTSLPEVVTFYTLISVNNYDLAFSNIIGSNMFNLLVLAFGDLIVSKSIYSFYDRDILIIVILGFVFSLLCVFANKRRLFNLSKIRYGIVSFIIVFLYLFFWIANIL